MIFAIVNVMYMILKDAGAKESQALNDTYVRFLDNFVHPILLDNKTKMISYYIETDAKNITRAPSSIQDNDTHMFTIARESNNKNYIVTLSWDPKDLKPGRNTIFLVNFFDAKTQVDIKQVDYSFIVFSSSTSMIVKNTVHQKAPNGMGAQIVNFPRAGQEDISLNMTKYGPRTGTATDSRNVLTYRIESVTFPVLIPP
ncbi:MAG TPA: hypothetical protein VH796_14375 [Nitrososphaeraceae archaeon]|jgi:hypothetical protein